MNNEIHRANEEEPTPALKLQVQNLRNVALGADRHRNEAASTIARLHADRRRITESEDLTHEAKRRHLEIVNDRARESLSSAFDALKKGETHIENQAHFYHPETLLAGIEFADGSAELAYQRRAERFPASRLVEEAERAFSTNRPERIRSLLEEAEARKETQAATSIRKLGHDLVRRSSPGLAEYGQAAEAVRNLGNSLAFSGLSGQKLRLSDAEVREMSPETYAQLRQDGLL